MLAIPDRLYVNSEGKWPSNFPNSRECRIWDFTILRTSVDRFTVLYRPCPSQLKYANELKLADHNRRQCLILTTPFALSSTAIATVPFAGTPSS
jgi:hypothetical protein